MRVSERQQGILHRLRDQTYLQIDELANEFQVTTQTIRRDINQLCDMGLARRHHGGVGLPTSLSNQNYRVREIAQRAEKQTLAQRVVQNIPEGSTIMLGIGTTIATIAEHLIHKSSLRVITNNFQVAAILGQSPHIEVWLAGGKLSSNDQDIVGHSALSFMGQFSADIGIVGCASVEVTESNVECAMEFKPDEAELSQCILSNTRQSWLVADKEKWSRLACVKVALLTDFDKVFT